MATKTTKDTSGKATVTQPSLETQLKKLNPLYARYLDVKVYGPEFKKILRQMLKERWYEDPSVLQNKMEAAIQNTPYYKKTTAVARNFDALTSADKEAKKEVQKSFLTAISGFDELSSEEQNKLIEESARKGITGTALQDYVNSAIFKSPGTTEGSPSEAQKDALTSNPALLLDNLAREYNTKASEKDKQALLTGTKTIGDFEQDYRESSKDLYPHLARQLDRGLSLEKIGETYKSSAARILEKNEDDIDMFDSRYSVAFNTEDNKGGYRQLSLPEWEKKLRTDEKYGWKFTESANNEVDQIMQTLTRAFGRIR